MMNVFVYSQSHLIQLLLQVGQSSLLASANTIQRTPAENYMLLNNHSYKSSQPTSNVTPQARENERRYSIQGTNLKGSIRRYVCSAGEYHCIFPTVNFKLFVHSVTSESKETTVVVNDNKNDGGSTKVHIHLCNVRRIRENEFL